ncbi:MAG: hypothetical protein ACLTKG_08655 [Collinsella intestinalis]
MTPRLTVDAASKSRKSASRHETVGDEPAYPETVVSGVLSSCDVGGELAAHAVVIGQHAHLALEP